MFARVVVAIVALGLIAAVLLGLRQARLRVANELAETHRRIVQHDRELRRLRAQIAAQLDLMMLEERLAPAAPTEPDEDGAGRPIEVAGDV